MTEEDHDYSYRMDVGDVWITYSALIEGNPVICVDTIVEKAKSGSFRMVRWLAEMNAFHDVTVRQELYSCASNKSGPLIVKRSL